MFSREDVCHMCKDYQARILIREDAKLTQKSKHIKLVKDIILYGESYIQYRHIYIGLRFQIPLELHYF